MFNGLRNRFWTVFILYFALLSTEEVCAQQKRLDSLRVLLNKSTVDSTRIRLLLILATEYNNVNPEQTVVFAEEALKLSQKNKDDYSEAGAYNQMGSAQQLLGYFNAANSYISKAEAIYLRLGKQKELGDTYTYYGNVAWGQGNHSKALEYCLKALEIREKINDKTGQALSITNIGVLYRVLNDYDRALMYLERALKIRESIKDEAGIATSYNNIGGVYEKKNEIEKAIAYQNKALDIHKKLGDRRNEGNTYNYLGIIAEKQGQLEKALEYHSLALEMRQALGDQTFIVASYNRLAKVLLLKKDYARAEYYLKMALESAQRIGARDRYTECLNTMHELSEAKGDFKMAMYYFKRYIAVRDSVFSLEKKRMVEEMNAKFSSDEKDRQLLVFKSQEELNKKEIDNKNLTLALVAIATIFMGVVAYMSFRKSRERAKINRQLQAQGELISIKNRELEEQKLQILKINEGLQEKNEQIEQASEELMQSNEEILAQRDNISQKNKQLNQVLELLESKSTKIESSIRYAQRIQTAMLPSKEQLKMALPHHFIMFRPKDIVSGDFYWLHKTTIHTFVAVVDCTGHGVPGAFMSLIGDAYLSLLIVQKGMTNPDDILLALDICIHRALKHEEKDNKNRDGMDISLVVLNNTQKTLEFAGAHQALYVVQNEKMQIFRGDKHGIAGNDLRPKKFTQHQILASEPTLCYLCSDGYQDQFGGPTNVKFGRKELANVLLKNSSLDLEPQKDALEADFDNWKGTHTQIDDVLCLGFKI